MKTYIYINNIRVENTLGRSVTPQQLCELMEIPHENAIVSDEDLNEMPMRSTYYIQDKDRFFIIRKTVIGN